MHPSDGPVALVLVAHDGARWLPTVIDGVAAQTAPIARVVAVDTGSKDESPTLMREAFGHVHTVKGSTSFPEAVAIALAELQEDPGPAGPPEWVWILHDDATPHPHALAALLTAAAEHPEAGVLGPKLREWPSLRRLLEVGVTLSGTGRRETGLERGEYDQGQHDEVRRVLAVNSAGMLVRRSVLEQLGGFDPLLPMFGNDIDFGWRAAAAGHTTLVVPQAVVFHAEAAHRGARRTPLTGRHTHYQERRAALYTLLVNAPARTLPLRTLRLLLGTLLRMLGFLMLRSVGEAFDELAALVSVYSRPRELSAARRDRRGRQVVPEREVRRLLAPWWLPYRHGLDFLGDMLAAVTNQAADVAERRRAAAAERDPASFAARKPAIDPDDPDALLQDTGLVARYLTNPIALVLTAVVVLGLVGARTALGSVSGGGLSPTPEGAGAWWRLHYESWHPLVQGTDIPAPPYLLPLALLATLLGGSPGAAVSAVLLLALPAAVWGAWRLLRVAGRLVSPQGAPRWMVLWGSATYALVPAVSGAWGDGRLGPVVAGAVLPWAAHAALGFADPEADRRWRAAWRTGLLVTLLAAFTPVGWLVALVLGVVVLLAALVLLPGVRGQRSVWGPPAVAVLVPPVLLSPWWIPAVLHSDPAALLLDAGRLPLPAVDGTHLLLGRLPDLGAPWWLGLVLPLLALLALIPVRTRIPVLVCWIAGLVTAAVAALVALADLDRSGWTSPPGLGFPLVALQGAAVVAVVLGAQGAVAAGLPGWRRWVAGLAAAVAVVVPVGGMAWFVASGSGALADGADDPIPAYMLQAAELAPEHGILVLRGSQDDGLSYTVVRGDGVTLGEDEVEALTPEDGDFSALVRDFASTATSADTVTALARSGIQYVVQPPPADPRVAAAIDATGGLSQASASDRSTRAWQLDEPPTDHWIESGTDWLRVVLLVVQGLGLVVVLVLCAPTTERRRRR